MNIYYSIDDNLKKDYEKTLYVFVYGTLKKGYGNNILLETSEFIDKAITKDKYFMIENEIPFVLLNKNIHHICGEIYKMKNLSVFYSLDRLEGYPDFYNRTIIDVITSSGKEYKCWIYYVNDVYYTCLPAKTKIVKIKDKKYICQSY